MNKRSSLDLEVKRRQACVSAGRRVTPLKTDRQRETDKVENTKAD